MPYSLIDAYWYEVSLSLVVIPIQAEEAERSDSYPGIYNQIDITDILIK
jgi:hypothetical protein